MNNSVMEQNLIRKVHARFRLCLPVLVILVQPGCVYAAGTGAASAGISVTAKITTCRPVIEAKDYLVTVKPSDGRNEQSAYYAHSYFPAEVVTIDNTSCESDVDVSGPTFTYKIHSPSIQLTDIGAIGTLNNVAGRIGSWAYDNGVTTLTVKAGTKIVLYAGISPVESKTDYISGSAEGSVTLTITPK